MMTPMNRPPNKTVNVWLRQLMDLADPRAMPAIVLAADVRPGALAGAPGCDWIVQRDFVRGASITNRQIRELNFPMDSLAEIVDGAWAIAILAVIIWAAWRSHNKEVDEQFSPPDSAPPTT
jgi:hypothetical protein